MYGLKIDLFAKEGGGKRGEEGGRMKGRGEQEGRAWKKFRQILLLKECSEVYLQMQ